MHLTLIDNWRAVAARSWSSRLIWLATLLSGIEAAMPLLAVFFPDGTTLHNYFGTAALVVSAAAGIARLIAQPKTLPAS